MRITELTKLLMIHISIGIVMLLFVASILKTWLDKIDKLLGPTATKNNCQLSNKPYAYPRSDRSTIAGLAGRFSERLNMLKQKISILGILVCLSAGAFADGMINPFESKKTNNSNHQTKDEAQAIKNVTSVKMDAKDCARLVQHQPRNDVNYKSGVDAYGKQVVGAELGGGHKLKLPATIEFPIAFNPLKGAAATRFGETSAGVGKVKYDISKNTFTFNGQVMNDKAISNLASRCRSVGR